MNILDLILLVGIAISAAWGAKKGFIRMVMITAGLVAAIILAVHYNDSFTQQLSNYFQASPLWVTMVAFILSSMILFALFRVAAKLFFRVAHLQQLGKRDQMGGALVGLVFGWFIMGYVVFLMLFLPLPYAVEPKFEESAFALKMGASVPFVYESSERLHPSQGSFMVKMEDALMSALGRAKNATYEGKPRRVSAVDRARVEDFLDRLERYFVSGI
jgi:uncharacterized membrane protein required for colicin V production